MKGDISANHFRPEMHYLRVLMQQGRVQLDSDWNEQAAILLRFVETLAADLIGPFGGPRDDLGFAIQSASQLSPAWRKQLNAQGLLPLHPGDVVIGPGRYYVDGLLCENPRSTTYLNQPDMPATPMDLGRRSYLLYLDVWERHLTAVQDPGIREVALGGPDTATRSKVVAQVKATEIPDPSRWPIHRRWPEFVAALHAESRASLKARSRPSERADQHGEPAARGKGGYSGSENQLYRVEIHDGGVPRGDDQNDGPGATFKWSRANGSVVFPLAAAIEGNVATLARFGPDGSGPLREGDWVELIDDQLESLGVPGEMLRIAAIEGSGLRVQFGAMPSGKAGRDLASHPLLRRWDQRASSGGGLDAVKRAVPIQESDGDRWLELEEGVQIQFQFGGTYRTGDYWLIPARSATADVEWPAGLDGLPRARRPAGIEHHYAPLATIRKGEEPEDRRTSFRPLTHGG